MYRARGAGPDSAPRLSRDDGGAVLGLIRRGARRVALAITREPATASFVVAVVLLQVLVLLGLGISFEVLGWLAETMLVASSLGVATLLALLLERMAGRFQGVALATAWLVVAFICYVDTLFFRAFRDFPSYAAAARTRELVVVRSAIPPLVQWVDALGALATLAVAVGLVLLAARSRRRTQRSRRPRGEWLLGLALAGVGILAPWIVNSALRGPSHGRLWVAGKVGLLAYHGRDVLSGVQQHFTRGPAPRPGEVARIRHLLERYHALAPSEQGGAAGTGEVLRPPGFARGLNVLLVQMESLQRSIVWRDIGTRPVTPFLRQLALEHLYFDNFFAQVGEGRTADADLLVHCSIYPSARGVAYVDYADADYDCLPRRLAAAGYSTVAFQGMSPDFWNLADMYRKIGFARFVSMLDFPGDEKIGLGVSDQAFLAHVATALDSLKRPFYAYAVTLSNHAPFDDRELPMQRDFFARGGSMGTRYVNMSAYADAALQSFFSELERRRLLDSTMVLVYGDHGALSRSSPGFEVATGIPPGDDVRAFLAENRVPLIVMLPPLIAGSRAARVLAAGGEVDLAPTVLHALGLPVPQWYFGKPLWTAAPRMEVTHSGGVASGDRLWLPSSVEGTCIEAGKRVRVERCAALKSFGPDLLDAADYLISQNALSSLRSGR